jgi:cobalt-zinc-cadmium efflux system protein
MAGHEPTHHHSSAPAAHAHAEHDDHHDHDEHDDHAHHAHGPGHAHAPKDFGRAFAVGIVLNGGFVIAEAVYGVLSNSMALLADAGHNLSDVLGLLLAWYASVLAKKIPSQRFTYGLRSSSILAALLNAALLLVVTGGIAWEAILRFSHPGQIESKTVIVIAAIGVAINTATALMFMAGRKGDLNIRGAFLHMVGDALISAGVVLAGVAILFTGWVWLDPLVSLVIAVIIVGGTWGLLRDSVQLALHAVPPGVDADAVRDYLASVEGVTEMHDLHIWGMSTTETALTAHLVMPAGYPDDMFRATISETLQRKYSIGHATIQIELGQSHAPCALAPNEIV